MATNGGTAKDAAAARRRRIAERGAERLALITGRVQSLSPSPPSVSLSQPSSTPPYPTSLSDENTDPNQRTSESSAGEDLASDAGSAIDNFETITGTSVPTSSKPEALAEQTPLITTSNKSTTPESQSRHRKTFSPKQLRPAITASENIRIICSITVALLVIMADAGFPVLGSDGMKSIILFRPLLLLLVTNVTTVAAYFILQKVKHRSTGDAGFANPIGTALEWGLLMKTGSSALFMDCSVYSVVVICGMGLLQLFE